MKEFFTTLYGKAIAVLTIIALLLGIAAEVISIQTNYYSMVVRKVDALKAEGINRTTREILNGKE